tara:strand:- start:1142 stop:3460 length:2319 start_codon:yes stop_codon:yes gene_type:complete
MKLTKNQSLKVSELTEKILEKLINSTSSQNIIFDAPTGSGKTFMVSETIKKITSSMGNDLDVSFLWLAPRQLHEQSKQKLENYLQDSKNIDCIFFREIDGKEGIQKDQIVFINWESINRDKKNLIIRENENNFTLDAMIKLTKKKEKKICLIIDESHISAGSENALNLIKTISPDVSLFVSATPEIDPKHMDEFVKLSYESVKEDQLIKDKIIINEGIVDQSKIKITSGKKVDTGIDAIEDYSNIAVLEKALEKQKLLVKKYKNENYKVNPLILIQLPDKNAQGINVEKLREDIERYLADKKITIENKKLGVYLSGDRQNIDDKNQPFDSVKVLLFKHAIATGWDCPRSQILVIFRDVKSFTFSVQTVGRICRFIDPEQGYFSDSDLNNAYIFTNISSIGIKDDYVNSFIIFDAIYLDKSKKYEPLNLQSWHRKRERLTDRLDPRFSVLFKDINKKYKLEEKIKVGRNRVTTEIIPETSVDKLIDLKDEIKGENKNILNDIEDLQDLLDQSFIPSLLRTEFFPQDRSVGQIKKSLFSFFEDKFDLNYLERNDHNKILKAILDEKNYKYFQEIIQKTKEEYLDLVKDKTREPLVYDHNWNIQKTFRFTGVTHNHPKNKVKKSILKSSSKTLVTPSKIYESEKSFISYLEKSDKVIWWFKNGEGDGTYFAVKCEDEEKNEFPFYVDFIVFFKNRTVGFYDTKSGFTLETKDIDAKNRGLRKAINSKHYKKFKLKGGIVVNTNPKDYSGVWRVYDSSNTKDITKIASKSFKDLDF